MKSIVAYLNELNKPLIIDEVEIPVLKIGQVLVQVHFSTICGAQVGEIIGAKGPDKYLPHLLGHEGGGIVLETGPGVTKVKSGDKVVLHWRKGKGIDAEPPKYKCGSKIIGGGWVTTFNKYAIISENRITPVPMHIPFSLASLLGCGITTGLGIINNEACLKMGQSIAVIGCGGVGMNVIQGANMICATPIIAIDINEYKREKALKFGATHSIINRYPFDDTEMFVLDKTNKKGADVVVECTGKSELINLAYKITAPGGKLILVGQPHHSCDCIFENMRQHYCGKTIMDSEGGKTNPDIDIPRYIKLYDNKLLSIDDMISGTYHLEDINNAIEKVKSGNCLRVGLIC